MRRWQLAAAAGIMGAGALAAWCFREELTARAIAERSPGQGLAAAAFLIGLYALKGLSLTFPISALTAAGGLLFPYPEALAVNLTGVAAAHLGPFLLGRRQEGGLEALTARYPKIRVLRPPADHRWRTVFLLRLAGATPGDSQGGGGHGPGVGPVEPRLPPVLDLPGPFRRPDGAGGGAVAGDAGVMAPFCAKKRPGKRLAYAFRGIYTIFYFRCRLRMRISSPKKGRTLYSPSIREAI